MKRLLCCVLVLVSCIISGCASGTDIPSTSGNVNGSDTGGYFHIDGYVHDEHKYDDFLEEHKEELPDNFLHVNQIAALGEFTFFSMSGNFGDYHYSFHDDQGETITLSIYHPGADIEAEKVEYSLVSLSAEMETMLRRTSGENDTRIEHGGAKYLYGWHGYLRYVIWEIDGITFRLSGASALLYDMVFKDYPNFDRLFSTDENEVKAALEEFKQLLNTK